MSNSTTIIGRMRAYIWLKASVTPVFMTAFFIAYFTILRHPLSTPVTIPFTALDHWIGFHPLALIPYITLWVYVCLPSLFMSNLRELLGHAFGNALLSAVGLLAFILWPTTTPPSNIDWSLHPSMLFLKDMDASGNACPSLHAAFAVFACFWAARVLRRLNAGCLAHVINVLWGLSIVYSTVATRQHVAIDALTGSLLGWLVVRLNLRLCAEPSP
ncbi:MAG: phosphatase PAP2 family protein [Opitutaceae bacterium]|jgi:hypothetical protein